MFCPSFSYACYSLIMSAIREVWGEKCQRKKNLLLRYCICTFICTSNCFTWTSLAVSDLSFKSTWINNDLQVFTYDWRSSTVPSVSFFHLNVLQCTSCISWISKNSSLISKASSVSGKRSYEMSASSLAQLAALGVLEQCEQPGRTE